MFWQKKIILVFEMQMVSSLSRREKVNGDILWSSGKTLRSWTSKRGFESYQGFAPAREMLTPFVSL